MRRCWCEGVEEVLEAEPRVLGGGAVMSVVVRLAGQVPAPQVLWMWEELRVGASEVVEQWGSLTLAACCGEEGEA